MKPHTLWIAALVLCILTGFLYWSNRHKPGESSKASADTPPAILKLDQNSITRLDLKKKDADAVILTKSSSGDCQITQPKPFRASLPPRRGGHANGVPQLPLVPRRIATAFAGSREKDS